MRASLVDGEVQVPGVLGSVLRVLRLHLRGALLVRPPAYPAVPLDRPQDRTLQAMSSLTPTVSPDNSQQRFPWRISLRLLSNHCGSQSAGDSALISTESSTASHFAALWTGHGPNTSLRQAARLWAEGSHVASFLAVASVDGGPLVAGCIGWQASLEVEHAGLRIQQRFHLTGLVVHDVHLQIDSQVAFQLDDVGDPAVLHAIELRSQCYLQQVSSVGETALAGIPHLTW